MKIAVIGAGNMGSAIAASLAGGADEVVCTARSAATRARLEKELPGVKVTDDNAEAVKGAGMVVLGVKPYAAAEVIAGIRDSVAPGASIVSVVAELTVAELRQAFRAEENQLEVFRVIPNTAIRFGESATFIAHAPGCKGESVAEIERVFNLSGRAFVVDEKEMAACTALASCGIAFFLRFIRAAAEGATELGLPPRFATEIAALTARGAAAVLSEGAHPEAEIDKVTTPGGLTIRGLNAMEAAGFNPSVIAALRACCPSS